MFKYSPNLQKNKLKPTMSKQFVFQGLAKNIQTRSIFIHVKKKCLIFHKFVNYVLGYL